MRVRCGMFGCLDWNSGINIYAAHLTSWCCCFASCLCVLQQLWQPTKLLQQKKFAQTATTGWNFRTPPSGRMPPHHFDCICNAISTRKLRLLLLSTFTCNGMPPATKTIAYAASAAGQKGRWWGGRRGRGSGSVWMHATFKSSLPSTFIINDSAHGAKLKTSSKMQSTATAATDSSSNSSSNTWSNSNCNNS